MYAVVGVHVWGHGVSLVFCLQCFAFDFLTQHSLRHFVLLNPQFSKVKCHRARQLQHGICAVSLLCNQEWAVQTVSHAHPATGMEKSSFLFSNAIKIESLQDFFQYLGCDRAV